MIFSIVFFVAYIVLITLFGHVAHWAMHKPWMKALYRAHMVHHFKLYPIDDFESDSYRSAGKDSGTIFFTVLAIPLLAIPIGAWLLTPLSLFWAIGSIVGGIVFGLLNDWVHASFHVRKNLLRYIPGWQKMRDRHYQHHIDVTANYGIWLFSWDRVFGTLRDQVQKNNPK